MDVLKKPFREKSFMDSWTMVSLRFTFRFS
jgi:hypothetical protein